MIYSEEEKTGRIKKSDRIQETVGCDQDTDTNESRERKKRQKKYLKK